MQEANRITLAITGASGLPYSLRLLECLIAAHKQISFLMSQAAHMVAALEMDLKLPSSPDKLQNYLCSQYNASPQQLKVYGMNQWTAPIASGSNVDDAMVVCPCTSGTLAAIANGMSDNLISRAADVVIKEQKKLILVPREMPFSALHLENMLKLARQGVVICPPNPGFYHKPQTIGDLVDFVVARILNHLGIKHSLQESWGSEL